MPDTLDPEGIHLVAPDPAPVPTQPQPAALPDTVSDHPEALPMIYRPSVLILGGIGALCVVGIIGLAAFGHTVEQGLVSLGTVAITALAGVLLQESRQGGAQ